MSSRPTRIWPTRLFALFAIMAATLVLTAVAAHGTEPDDHTAIEIVAPAPTFTDPTCDANFIQHEKPDVEGLQYWPDDSETDDGRLRITYTVEALDGYKIVGYEPGGDSGEYPWYHDYAPFPDCDEDTETPPADDDDVDTTPASTHSNADDAATPGSANSAVLPNTGAEDWSLLVIGLVMVTVGSAAVLASRRVRPTR